MKNLQQDDRLELLKNWLRDSIGMTAFGIAPASSDASFRRYFRITAADKTYIVMDAPPAQEDCRPFIKIAQAFAGLSLNVPLVLAQDLTQGFLLLTDLGSQQYLNNLNDDSAEGLYSDAIAALVTLQRGSPDGVSLPPYDLAMLLREMELFREWFLGRYLQLPLSAVQQRLLDSTFEALAHSALAQPTVWVHRDYHSRNLMVTGERNPGILDFQDAVVGPITYDLVSLLRDCYIRWPKEQVLKWVRQYYDQTRDLFPSLTLAQLSVWFDWMGVQRHLKATGIFARLNIRDGKPGYLKDIPRTLGYVRDVSADYAELKGFNKFIVQDVWPALLEKSARLG